MASLYKTANARQRRIFRIIEDAVLNVAHAHKDFDGSYAKSIAKRATGTLTAVWSEVLALPLAPDQTNDLPCENHSSSRFLSTERARRGRASIAADSARPQLRKLQKKIGIMVREARVNGQTERQEALIDVLRMLDKTKF